MKPIGHVRQIILLSQAFLCLKCPLGFNIRNPKDIVDKFMD